MVYGRNIASAFYVALPEMSFCQCVLCQGRFVCFAEEENSNEEHNRKGSNTQIYASCYLADHGNYHSSGKCRSLAADIINTKVFS